MYRTYVTDSLFYYGRQMTLTTRYVDMLSRKTDTDNRSGDEIAMDIIARHRLKVAS